VTTSDALVEDMDGDGVVDLVAPYAVERCPTPDRWSCVGRGGTAVVLGDGTGRFGPDTNAGAAGAIGAPERVALGDLDGDDDRDVVSASQNGLQVHLNDGAGGLSVGPYTPMPDAELACEVRLADVDGDGTTDAVVSAWDNHGHLFAGRGDGTFDEPSGLATAGGDERLCNDVLTGDLLGDDRVDVAFLSGRANRLAVLENRR
jgi:hypothetical protein